MERAENTARIIDITETFDRDRSGVRNWMSIVQLNGDMAAFSRGHGKADRDGIIDFYLLDNDNPTSLKSVVRTARDNARVLRPFISTETWSHLNVFHNRMQDLTAAGVQASGLSRLCAEIKAEVQHHTGIVEGTMYRDQGWLFYQLGRNLERADQTSRILDIKYYVLLPLAEVIGSPLDINQWQGLLRSVAGYQALRRLYPSGLTHDKVISFLLFNRSFPRSCALCLRTMRDVLAELADGHDLRGGAMAMERIDALRAWLDGGSVERLIDRGIHETLDWLQTRLGEISDEIGRGFFMADRVPDSGPS